MKEDDKQKKQKEMWESILPLLNLPPTDAPGYAQKYMAAKRAVQKGASNPELVAKFNAQRMTFKEFVFHNFSYKEIQQVLNMDVREFVVPKKLKET